MTKNNEKVYVIACKIISPDLQRAADRANIEAEFEFLHFGLHNTPAELTRQVQQAIDRVSQKSGYGRIILGYGICGQGTASIKARKIPLVIPQAHDCITLFLGSDAAYKEQFQKCPGTYYFTKGWFDENPNYETTLRIGLNIETPGKTYTQDELQIVEQFLAGWQKNYSRAVFVRASNDDDDENYRQIAKNVADNYGWKYEEIIGNTRLLEKLLVAEKTDDEILFVEPGFTLNFDPSAGRLESLPPKE